MKLLRLREHARYNLGTGARHYDRVRGRYVRVTDEEGVRQDVIASLLADYGYPLEAIRSEELVARGTDDRGRADVLVELPHRIDRVTVTTQPPAPPPRVAYSDQVAAVRATLPPGVSVVEVPNALDLTLAGAVHRVPVLGFERVAAGHALVAETPSDLQARGYPPLLYVLLTGHGMSAPEKALASRFGIARCDWTVDASIALLGVPPRAELSGEQAESARVLAWTTLSDDGEHGYTLLFASETSIEGVLVRIEPYDGAKSPEPAAGSPPGAPAPPPARVGDVTAIVIECKARGVVISQQVLEQGLRYATVRNARFLAVVNGSDNRSFLIREGEPPLPIDDLPTYAQITSDKALEVAPLPDDARSVELPGDLDDDLVHWHARARGYAFAANVPAEMLRPLLRLHEALYCERALFTSPIEVEGVHFMVDRGPIIHEPGSSSGGSWPGSYRDLVVEVDGVHCAVSFGMFATWRGRAAGMPTTITLPGNTYLICGQHVDAVVESSLQLDIVKRAKTQNGRLMLMHDGTMTVGKGAIPRKTVLDHLLATDPALVQRGTVLLGEVDGRRPLSRTEALSLLARFTRYVRARTALKAQIRQARARG